MLTTFGDFNINLLFKSEKIFSNKIAKTPYEELPPLTKKYLEFCFSNSLEQIITSPTRTTDRTAAPIDHVLTNSSHKVSQPAVIDLGLLKISKI